MRWECNYLLSFPAHTQHGTFSQATSRTWQLLLKDPCGFMRSVIPSFPGAGSFHHVWIA